MSAMSTFFERLRCGPLLCDGAMGTELHCRGVSYGQCFEQLNLTSPELIKTIHLEYLRAGAQIIQTNTFGANRTRLATHGMTHLVGQINQAAVTLAREACDLSNTAALLAGNVGPLGVVLAPSGLLTPSHASATFREQTEALVEEGVDLLLLETFSDLTEMGIALSSVRHVTDLPIVALMTFGLDGTIASGKDAHQVARVLLKQGADVIGANCSFGPEHLYEIVKAMSPIAAGSAWIAVQPNAGLPERVGNQSSYPATPQDFANWTHRFLEIGVRLIGGCCGTTPAHIAAMSPVLSKTLGVKCKRLEKESVHSLK